MDELAQTSRIAVSGLKAQAKRLRVISQNMANVDSVADQPGTAPYRRKLVTFQNVLDRNLGADVVRIKRTITDNSEFRRKYEPGHPGADENGYVLMPNINPLVEMMDMRQAQKTYEANLNVISTAGRMLKATVELLR